MFYYLYKIRNNLNGKIYVGVHKTRNMNDGYMGSGKVIQSAIKKYGIENFTKVILETFENAKAMYAREKEVVNDEFLSREDTYNLSRGGHGGFDYINKNNLALRNPWTDTARAAAAAAIQSMTVEDWSRIHKTRFLAVSLETRRAWNKNGRLAAQSAEANAKRSATMQTKQQGENNSQFGTMWITDETENKKVKKTYSIPAGWRKGRTLIKRHN